MNTSILTSDLCPIDRRRTSKELYIKLLVVHFTVITAYCHLLSIRSERVLSWRPINFFITPLSIIVQHVAGLAVIAIAYGCSVLRKKIGNLQLNIQPIDSPFVWLLGNASGMAPQGPIYSALPSSNQPDTNVGSQGDERITKIVGRTLVAAAFEAQCIGAIILYHRRRQRGAVTHLDQRIFELACGGVIIGVLTLGTIMQLPIFRQSLPPYRSRSMLERAIFWLRYIDISRSNDLENNAIWQFWKENLLSFLIMIATGRFLLLGSLRSVFAGNWMGQVAGSGQDRLWVEGMTWMILVVAVGFNVFMRLVMRLVPDWDELVLIVQMGILLCVFPVYMEPVRYSLLLFEQIGELASWPVDVTCPMLWSDPYANYIWWLA
ncbi:hypothetical protein IFR05_004081 [Cadophora sp. M221]|nr:hypothetical protein IFR05_004081 [Cadophora sp. M221]